MMMVWFEIYKIVVHTMLSVIYNNMTELSAIILELIYENDKDSVTRNSKPRSMENIDKILGSAGHSLLSICIFSFLLHFCEHP